MPRTITINDELYDRIRQTASLVGYGSEDERANHILLRFKKALDEYCGMDEDVRDMSAQLGYAP